MVKPIGISGTSLAASGQDAPKAHDESKGPDGGKPERLAWLADGLRGILRKEFAPLLLLSFVVVLLTLVISYYVIALVSDPTAKATVIAAVLSFLGLIFSATYKEISSHYQALSTRLDDKWKLVNPFISKYYVPWVNSANAFSRELKRIDPTKKTAGEVTKMLYLTSVFYGYRLRFLTEEGGFILLSSVSDAGDIKRAYGEVIEAFQWAGVDTSRCVSKLQKLFIVNNKEENPFVLNDFFLQVSQDKDEFKLSEMVKLLDSWLTKANRDALCDRLDSFSKIFDEKINRLIEQWEG